MRVLVFGAGAIGCVHGGFLALAGHKVTLLGRPEKMRSIAADGLNIYGIWGQHSTHDLKVSTNPEELLDQAYDLILLSVRAYDTAAVAANLCRLTGPDTLVVALQNGLGNLEILGEVIPSAQLIAARVIFGAKMPTTNTVTVTVIADDTRLGPVPGGPPTEKVEAVAGALREAGIPTRAEPDVTSFIWAKVLYNSALNPLSALLGSTYGGLAESPSARKLMRQVIDEGFDVANACEIRLPWPNAAAYWDHFLNTEIPATAAHRSSMLQAIEQGKQTEIEALNGALVRMGRQHGVATPLNEMLTLLIHAREEQLAEVR